MCVSCGKHWWLACLFTDTSRKAICCPHSSSIIKLDLLLDVAEVLQKVWREEDGGYGQMTNVSSTWYLHQSFG